VAGVPKVFIRFQPGHNESPVLITTPHSPLPTPNRFPVLSLSWLLCSFVVHFPTAKFRKNLNTAVEQPRNQATKSGYLCRWSLTQAQQIINHRRRDERQQHREGKAGTS
jgi:ribosomal protein L34